MKKYNLEKNVHFQFFFKNFAPWCGLRTFLPQQPPSNNSDFYSTFRFKNNKQEYHHMIKRVLVIFLAIKCLKLRNLFAKNLTHKKVLAFQYIFGLLILRKCARGRLGAQEDPLAQKFASNLPMRQNSPVKVVRFLKKLIIFKQNSKKFDENSQFLKNRSKIRLIG